MPSRYPMLSFTSNNYAVSMALFSYPSATSLQERSPKILPAKYAGKSQ